MEVNDYKENYGNGWISLYRSVKKHWIFENDKYFKWWVIMLFEVNHSEKKFNRYYEIHTIKKGQSVNSLRTWSELFKTTPKTVSKFFTLLEKDSMISLEKIGKGKQALSLVTIENYTQYQRQSKQDLPQGGNKEETESKQDLPTNNNGNKDNNDNKVNKIEDRKSDFYKILSPYSVDYSVELVNKFFDYWSEHGVKDRKMRFEKEKSFDIKLRLKKWSDNDKKWNPEKNKYIPKDGNLYLKDVL